MVTQTMPCVRMTKSRYFLEKNVLFITTLDLIKHLKQIKLQLLLLTFAPISELPSSYIGLLLWWWYGRWPPTP